MYDDADARVVNRTRSSSRMYRSRGRRCIAVLLDSRPPWRPFDWLFADNVEHWPVRTVLVAWRRWLFGRHGVVGHADAGAGVTVVTSSAEWGGLRATSAAITVDLTPGTCCRLRRRCHRLVPHIGQTLDTSRYPLATVRQTSASCSSSGALWMHLPEMTVMLWFAELRWRWRRFVVGSNCRTLATARLWCSGRRADQSIDVESFAMSSGWHQHRHADWQTSHRRQSTHGSAHWSRVCSTVHTTYTVSVTGIYYFTNNKCTKQRSLWCALTLLPCNAADDAHNTFVLNRQTYRRIDGVCTSNVCDESSYKWKRQTLFLCKFMRFNVDDTSTLCSEKNTHLHFQLYLQHFLVDFYKLFSCSSFSLAIKAPSYNIHS